MSRVTTDRKDRARLAEPADGAAYDPIAEGYAAENEVSLLNAHYERPAMLDLAGDVTGRRILDAGCGAGPLSAALRERGALVTGIDASPGMLELARRRLGPDTDLQVADLAEPLPFSDDAFDDVVASLVLHYLRDWGPPLAELHRVLVPGGRLIASVDHPFALALTRYRAGEKAEYFGVTERTEEWTMGGGSTRLTFWDRPLHAMTDAFTAAGFRIEVISEPPPARGAEEHFPEYFAERSDRRFLSFLFFVLRAA